MRSRLSAAMIAASAALLAVPAAAKVVDPNDAGRATETQERLAEGREPGLPWDLVGLLGLLGLLGLRPRHADDGYHPAPVE